MSADDSDPLGGMTDMRSDMTSFWLWLYTTDYDVLTAWCVMYEKVLYLVYMSMLINNDVSQ